MLAKKQEIKEYCTVFNEWNKEVKSKCNFCNKRVNFTFDDILYEEETKEEIIQLDFLANHNCEF